jgi:hypothetical protein
MQYITPGYRPVVPESNLGYPKLPAGRLPSGKLPASNYPKLPAGRMMVTGQYRATLVTSPVTDSGPPLKGNDYQCQ